jgi:polysaccharide chain length determinant protein (PEP-CTERM system associated)
MLGHRELTMQDYMEMLKRRFWLLLTLPVLFLVGGFGISHLVTPQYMSQTLVIIEQQKVPEDYVKSVISEDLDERLASMKEQILSRSRIQPIIERYNLFPDSKYTMDDRVEMTQKAIGVKPIPSATGGMPGFFITFRAQDPRTAQQVCSEITSLFITENLSVREQSAEGTTDFLKQQLADSKAKLDEQDAKLAAFQQKYIGRLPEQESSNANTLQALTTQLDAATQSVNHAQQNVTFLEAMVSQQTREQSRPDGAGGPSTDERRVQLKALLTQKQELETLYTPDYPDVVAITRKIADLQAEIAHMPAQPAASTPPPAATASAPESPQLQQLRAQLHAAQQSMAEAKQQQSAIEGRVRDYEAKIESSPVIEEEYKQITRDHETALQFYNTLLTKMNESSMATALERRQQGEQFRLMDAANLPQEPTSPNRVVFAGGGFGIGLVLGLLIAGLLEYRDTSVRNERDIFAFTKLPTLAIIAHMDGISQQAPEPGRKKLFSRTNKPLESVSG